MTFIVKPAFAAIEPVLKHAKTMQLANRRKAVVAVCIIGGRWFSDGSFAGYSITWFCAEIISSTGRHATCKKEFVSRQIARLEQTNKLKNHMSTLTAKGNWNIAKGKLKQKFAQLTNDDLQFIEGKEEELIGRIQKRTGQARKKIERSMGECSSCHR